MKKMSLLLSLAITMAVLTTLLIYVGFAVLSPSKESMILLSILSLCGYSGSYFYYLSYKQQKS